MTRSQALGLALGFAAGMLVAWATSCASVPPRTVDLTWMNCRGNYQGVRVEYRREWLPAAACVALAIEHDQPAMAAWFAVATPVACTLHVPGRAIIVLPLYSPDWLIQHELGRAMSRPVNSPVVVGDSWDCQIAREQ